MGGNRHQVRRERMRVAKVGKTRKGEASSVRRLTLTKEVLSSLKSCQGEARSARLALAVVVL